MEKKSNKGIIIALCTVIIVLIATITYLFVSGTVAFNVKKIDKNKIEEKEELGLNSDIVKKLYGSLSCGDGTLTDFYESDSYTNKTLLDETKISLVICNTDVVDMFEQTNFDNLDDILYTLDGEVILTKIDDMFGKDNGYRHITNQVTLPGIKLSYNEETEKYEYFAYDEVLPAVVTMDVFNKLVKAVQYEDSIVLTEKMYVYDYNEQAIYKDINGTKLITKAKDNYYEEDKYFDKGSTITYTFKKGENNNYYFYSSKIEY